MGRLLIVDDEPGVLKALKMTLEGHHSVMTAEGGIEALKTFREQSPDLVLLDIGLPDKSGLEVLEEIKSLEPEALVIMVTAVEDTRTVVKALKAGAYDYLVKPVDAQEVKITIKNALQNRVLKDKIKGIQRPNIERYSFELIGQSPPVKAMVEIARRVAPSVETPVLILGETGSGKGVLARTIHYSSSELPGPFVVVNCTAIAHDLFESELFGYDRGAFTGARADGRKGRIDEAACGTLFLDEIGSMPLTTQVKLLGVLDERQYYKVGGDRPHPLRCRVIAATNNDLEKAVEEGRFRSDLFYRLNVVRVEVPSLRERNEDIMLIAEHFLDLYNRKFERNFKHISPQAARILVDYHWPGNIRELRNTLERIILLESGDTLLPEHLAFLNPREMTVQPSVSASTPPPKTLDYQEVIKDLMQEALRKTEGNVVEASRILNMPAHKVRYRLKKYGIGS
jgi:DNA-binding NtrC family response regulator